MNLHLEPIDTFPSPLPISSLEQARIGVDIGRVLMAPTDAGGHADTSFLSGSDDDAMSTPPSDGAFPVVRELVLRTKGNVWLVSKAGRRIQELTRRWLLHWDFYTATGVDPGQVHFCRERREKREVAAGLQLSHFIDDRIDVHQHLRGTVPLLYLFGHQRSGTIVPSWVSHVLSWDDGRRALLESK
jgi:hypothetical protein